MLKKEDLKIGDIVISIKNDIVYCVITKVENSKAVGEVYYRQQYKHRDKSKFRTIWDIYYGDRRLVRVNEMWKYLYG